MRDHGVHRVFKAAVSPIRCILDGQVPPSISEATFLGLAVRSLIFPGVYSLRSVDASQV